jgi:hypothetical protein
MAEHVVSPRAQVLPGAGTAYRWLAPVGIGIVSAAVTMLRKCAEPGMPRMSSEWLLTHDKFSGNRWTN